MEPAPRIPENLSPYAREILSHLKGHPAAQSFVLGGGVALNHYLEFRPTVDLDGWWRKGKEHDPETLQLLKAMMDSIAKRDQLLIEDRFFAKSETHSFELRQGPKKVFSLQVAPRDVELETPRPSPWGQVSIESFRDNLASKMCALVGRGAPRDILDIYTLCQKGLATSETCWRLFAQKQPGTDLAQAKLEVLKHLAELEKIRPLPFLPEPERRAAAAVRHWLQTILCKSDETAEQMGLQPLPGQRAS